MLAYEPILVEVVSTELVAVPISALTIVAVAPLESVIVTLSLPARSV